MVAGVLGFAGSIPGERQGKSYLPPQGCLQPGEPKRSWLTNQEARNSSLETGPETEGKQI